MQCSILIYLKRECDWKTSVQYVHIVTFYTDKIKMSVVRLEQPVDEEHHWRRIKKKALAEVSNPCVVIFTETNNSYIVKQ